MRHRLKWWWLRLRRKTFWVPYERGVSIRGVYDKSTRTVTIERPFPNTGGVTMYEGLEID